MREESMRNAQSTATARTPGVRFVDEETLAARRAFLDQVDAETEHVECTPANVYVL